MPGIQALTKVIDNRASLMDDGCMRTYNRYTMLTVILLCIALFFTFYCYGSESDVSRLLQAIHKVETGGRVGAIMGDNGRALGPLQIHKEYWKDSGVIGKYSDCASYEYSCKVVIAYWNKYAPHALANQDYETLARVHNGGPHGGKREQTKKYWEKVRKQLTNEQVYSRI